MYFDYSPEALEFKRLLHEEWEGADYPDFLRELFQRIPSERAFYQLWGGSSPEELDWDVVEEAWGRELVRWGGAAALQEHWRRARDLRIEYVLCNALDGGEALLRCVEDRAGAVVWWSNVFFSFFSNWYYSSDARGRIYREWIRALAARAPRAVCYGRDHLNAAVRGLRAAECAGALARNAEGG